jgi:large repetitive protein
MIGFLKGRRTTASVVTVALIVGVPMTFAVLHPGYPTSDVKLNARDVWVTNSQGLLAGRLNRQIDDLSGAVRTASSSFDVHQDGDAVFLQDERNNTLQRIDPAYTTLADPVALPPGAEVSYGGGVLAIVSPDSGKLWVVNAADRIEFDASSTPPNATLGTGGQATVSTLGTVFAVAPTGSLLRFPADGEAVVKSPFPKLRDFQLSAVGENPVVLDLAGDTLVKGDRSTVALHAHGLRLQQPGADNRYAVVASADALLEVPLDGEAVAKITAKTNGAPSTPQAVAAPVFLDGCAHGAWADSQRYVKACDGKSPRIVDISQQTRGSELEFRVNRSVIVLNNLTNGDAWVLDSAMQLVNNWKDVTPPKDDESKDGNKDAAKQSYEDTLVKRTEENHAPAAVDDVFGVRPGKTTILPVLDNDSDVDGDVLTISAITDVPESVGHIELIDGGRALQFTSAPGAVGGTSLRYTVTDGRPGGVAQASVALTIRPPSENLPPLASRSSAVTVESGQSVSYNVLADWIDPDGDDLQLTDAVAQSGDTVRLTPDGFVTFQHTSSELGVKQVNFTVSDGALTAHGTLAVDVKPAGTLNPVGTPDFAAAFVGESVVVSPLKNDRSPSGATLSLIGVDSLSGSGTFSPNLDRGTVQFSAAVAGTYYLQYTVGAGAKTSIGVIRIDVVANPDKPLPPIAVKDVAYVHGSEPTTVSVLDNDISPTGNVIGIQTVEVPPEAGALSIEVLNSTVLRIASATPLTRELQIFYTISDGVSSATAGVTVIPVAPLVKHQAPVAVDDLVTVRAGDIATIDVLANDYHPDGAPMSVDPRLVDAGSAGLAFVTGGNVRFQAPTSPGQYSVAYEITDPFQESAIGRVLFTVTALDAKTNRPPLPVPVVSRSFADATTRVQIPLAGIDPDGDSVTLTESPGSPRLGEIVDQGSDYFDYRAYPDSTGTDSFTYQVADTYGATAIGTVRIGVIPRSGDSLPPTAVNDAVSLRPGRVGTVDVLANDSDPNGYSIKVEPKALTVPKGIKATVIDNRVVVDAPEAEGAFAIGYTLTNGHAGTDTAVINVAVSKTAPLQFPTAIDHVLQVKQIAGKRTVAVNVLEGAQNPGGLVDDLVPAVLGPNAKSATVLANGIIQVTPGTEQKAIAYSLTNTIDKLTSMAFIIVPALPRDGYDQPPTIKPHLAPQTTDVNTTKTWNLKDVVFVPSGRPAMLTGKATVSATRSNGAPVYADATTLTYTPEKDYRGPATIQFEVTDGTSPSDPKGNKATLSLPITVGDANFEDIAPTFTPPTVKVEADGSTTVDLHQATSHPNPQVIARTTYSGLQGATSAIAAQLSGSTLVLTAPRAAKVGSTAVLKFTVRFKDFTVAGKVNATVVSSLKPLAQAVADTLHARRYVVTQVDALDNDTNPFPDTPLRIVDATLENPASGAALSHTSSTISVTPGPSFIGDVSVVYTVQDATNDESRKASGRVVVTVWDVPDRPAAPTIIGTSDSSATIRFDPPPSINGSPVTKYTVRSSPPAAAPTCTAGANCTFTGLSNGTAYTFFVTAINEVGASEESAASAAVTPYRVPSAPTSANISAGGYAPATLSMSWGAPSDQGGGRLTYNWAMTQGSGEAGTTSGNAASVGGKTAGTYSFHVQACNPAGCSGWTQSNQAGVSNPPPPPAPSVTLSRGQKEPNLTTAYFYHIEARNFAANVTFTVHCYTLDEVTAYRSDKSTLLRFDGAGNFGGDIACWDGFGNNDYVVINGVTSNTTKW